MPRILAQSFLKNRKGSLLLIFLFTTGLLAVLVTGVYFIVTGSTVQQAAIERQGAKLKVERGLEQVHKSELERLCKDYLTNTCTQTLVASFTASPYQTALASATNWAFDTGTLKEAADGNPGSLSVTMPDQVTYPLAAKANPVSTNTDFGEHPLSMIPGTHQEITLSGNFTPTWTDKVFAYSRKFVAYKEIPVSYIPLSAAYNVGNLALWETMSMAGGPVAYFKGDSTHANAVVAYDVGATSIAPDLPNLVSSYGMLPEEICVTANSSAAAALQQQYRRASGAKLITFNGSVIAPATSGFSRVSVDGRFRCVVDLSLFTSGMIATNGTKYFVTCSNAAGLQGGVVIKDTVAGTPASASVSIATNGPLYLWTYKTNKNSTRTPIVAATSNGVVALMDSNYTGTGTPTTRLNFSFTGHLSAYAKPTTLLTDTFGRTGALSGSTPTYTAESLTWGTGSGDQTCATGSLSATTSGSWTPIIIGGITGGSSYAKGPLGYFITTSSFANGKSMSLIFSSTALWTSTVNQYELKVALSAGGALTASLNSISGGVATADNMSTSPSYSAGTHTWGFIHAVATNEVFITLDGALILKKKLTVPLATVPVQAVWKMDNSITATKFETITSPFGTLLSSPQTQISGTDTVDIYGSMAIGAGIASSLDSGATLNFNNKSAVATALQSLCERVLIHYPSFYKP